MVRLGLQAESNEAFFAVQAFFLYSRLSLFVVRYEVIRLAKDVCVFELLSAKHKVLVLRKLRSIFQRMSTEEHEVSPFYREAHLPTIMVILSNILVPIPEIRASEVLVPFGLNVWQEVTSLSGSLSYFSSNPF